MKLLFVMPTQKQAFDHSAGMQEIDLRALRGIEIAVRYVRSGRFITAVKLIEELNPGLDREQAKMIVNSFGYRNEFKWPEELNLPLRCL